MPSPRGRNFICTKRVQVKTEVKTCKCAKQRTARYAPRPACRLSGRARAAQSHTSPCAQHAPPQVLLQVSGAMQCPLLNQALCKISTAVSVSSSLPWRQAAPSALSSSMNQPLCGPEPCVTCSQCTQKQAGRGGHQAHRLMSRTFSYLALPSSGSALARSAPCIPCAAPPPRPRGRRAPTPPQLSAGCLSALHRLQPQYMSWWRRPQKQTAKVRLLRACSASAHYPLCENADSSLWTAPSRNNAGSWDSVERQPPQIVRSALQLLLITCRQIKLTDLQFLFRHCISRASQANLDCRTRVCFCPSGCASILGFCRLRAL